MELTDLPLEIFRLIVERHLSPEDLQQVSQTNSALREYLHDNASIIWKAFILRDFPFFDLPRYLQYNDDSTLKNAYFQIRKSYNFIQLILYRTGLPVTNQFIPIMLKTVTTQFIQRMSLPLDSLFELNTLRTSQENIGLLQCSRHIDHYLNQIPLDIRTPLTEEQRVRLRLVLRTFLRGHVPIATLIPVLRNNKYIVTRVTLMMLPEELRRGLYFV